MAWLAQTALCKARLIPEMWPKAALNLHKKTLARPQGLVGTAQGLPRRVTEIAVA